MLELEEGGDVIRLKRRRPTAVYLRFVISVFLSSRESIEVGRWLEY
jgi:hypothetical protein